MTTRSMTPALIRILLLVLLTALTAPVRAQECADYSTHLRWRTCVETRSYAEGLSIAGGLLYVADQTGVAIYDLTAPELAALIGALDTPGRCMDDQIDGDYGYVADSDGGFHVLNVSDSTAPAGAAIVGSLSTPDQSTMAIAISGDRVCLGETALESSLHIAWTQCEPVDVDPVPVTRLDYSMEVYPNPFNPRMTVSFDVAQRQWVDISVCDLSGRRLSGVFSGMQDSGPHEVLWDARDMH